MVARDFAELDFSLPLQFLVAQFFSLLIIIQAFRLPPKVLWAEDRNIIHKKFAMSDFFKNLKNGVIGALFPTNLTCELCGRDVFDNGYFCENCKEEIVEIGEDICERCGRRNVEKPYGCSSCSKTKFLDLSRSVYLYEGGAERLVKKFKYDDCRYLAKYFAKKLKKIYLQNFFAPDIITFVPMTAFSEYDRGYNQSRLLAEALSEEVGVVCAEVLEKVKSTSHQSGLDHDERQKNLKNAFALTEKKLVKGKKVLLIDDVLTTGATADEIAGVLKGGGAKSVYLMTIASVRFKNFAPEDGGDQAEEDEL